MLFRQDKMRNQLFDNFERARKEFKENAEPLFEYYNTSARPELEEIRNMLERWYLKFPESAKVDLRARFRSKVESDHQGAFFELYIHELFSGMGFVLEPHPELENGSSKHPDFLATRNNLKMYIEATVAAPEKTEISKEQRVALVMDKINEIISPDFLLDIEIKGAPDTQPSSKNLCSNLGSWLTKLDYDEIQSIYENKGYEGLPVHQWNHEGWSLRFRPHPRQTRTNGGKSYGIIGSSSGEVKSYDGRISLFNSLRKKAKGYGKLNLPFLICINCIDTY